MADQRDRYLRQRLRGIVWTAEDAQAVADRVRERRNLWTQRGAAEFLLPVTLGTNPLLED